MDPKIDPKIAQNARKARLRPGTLPGWILGSFLVDFGGHFGALFGSILKWFSTILANMHKYAQIQAQRRKDAQNTCKCGQIFANTRRYTQIRANTSRYTHIRANTRKYMQTRPNTHRYTDAHRKDTANSHEQLQGAPFSSVRRHVPASLIMITRFPFTYQTGYLSARLRQNFSQLRQNLFGYARTSTLVRSRVVLPVPEKKHWRTREEVLSCPMERHTPEDPLLFLTI